MTDYDFEPFAPIDFLGPKEEKELSEEEKLKIRLKQLEDFVEKQRQEIEKLKQQLEQTKKAYQMRVKTLENEKQLLLEEVKKLKQENENLKQNLQKLNQILAQAMAEKQKVEKSIKSLASQFSQTIQFLEKRWFSLAERIIVDVLKEVLKKDELHREEDLKRIFRSVFMEKIVEGEITIRANPQDLELIKEVLQEVKGDLVKFELVPDPQKARGEFEIETENFFIERNYDEIVPEIVHEFLNRYLNEGIPSEEADSKKSSRDLSEEKKIKPSQGQEKGQPKKEEETKPSEVEQIKPEPPKEVEVQKQPENVQEKNLPEKGLEEKPKPQEVLEKVSSAQELKKAIPKKVDIPKKEMEKIKQILSKVESLKIEP
jgi:hypothetical protein